MFVLYLLSTFIDAYIFSFLCTKNLINKNKLPLFLFIMIIGVINYKIGNIQTISPAIIPFINLFTMVIFLMLLNIYLYNTLRESIIYTFQFFICSLISELITGIIFSMILKLDLLFLSVSSPIKFSIMLLINLFLKIFLVSLIKHLSINFDIFSHYELLIVIMLFILSIIILGSYTYFILIMHQHISDVYHLFFFSITILFLNIGVAIQFFIMKTLHKQRIEKENIKNEIALYRRAIKDSTEAQKSFESIFHDFKNSIILIDQYVRNEEIKQALAYIEKFQKEITFIQDKQLHIYTSQEELNYLLIAKEFYAKSQNIEMKIDCFLTSSELLSNDVIVALLGNLLDNAINACIIDTSSSYKYIKLKLKQVDNNLYIDIKNSISKRSIKNNIRDGIGIKNIKKVINRNGGFYNRKIGDDFYHVKIILWGKNEKLFNI